MTRDKETMRHFPFLFFFFSFLFFSFVFFSFSCAATVVYLPVCPPPVWALFLSSILSFSSAFFVVPVFFHSNEHPFILYVHLSILYVHLSILYVHLSILYVHLSILYVHLSVLYLHLSILYVHLSILYLHLSILYVHLSILYVHLAIFVCSLIHMMLACYLLVMPVLRPLRSFSKRSTYPHYMCKYRPSCHCKLPYRLLSSAEDRIL